MASFKPLTITMGRIGPKISSCITLDPGVTSLKTVGAEAQGKAHEYMTALHISLTFAK